MKLSAKAVFKAVEIERVASRLRYSEDARLVVHSTANVQVNHVERHVTLDDKRAFTAHHMEVNR